jgi:hypothetical protein
MGLFVVSLVVLVLVNKEDDATSGGADIEGGADPNAPSADDTPEVSAAKAAAASAGGCRDGEEMVGTKCLVKCEDGKIRVGEICQATPMLKTQTMNNATVHTVTHGNKDIELGSIIHSGILKGIKLTADAKEQGWGNQCSSFELWLMRGGQPITRIINQNLGRTNEYKSFSLDPEIIPGTAVREGDSVRMTIKGWYPGCATWIKNIVVAVTVAV